jgi:hypothetical protein
MDDNIEMYLKELETGYLSVTALGYGLDEGGSSPGRG